MSHYTLLVIGDVNIEEALDPFWELDLNEYDLKHDYRAEFVLEYTPESAEEDRIKVSKTHPEYEKMTTEEFMGDYHCYSYYEKYGGYGYFWNPNGKWDWYSTGGRWAGFFKAKEGCKGELGGEGVYGKEAKEGYYDIIRKGDIDFEGMKKDALEEAEKDWNEYVNSKSKDIIREKKEEYIKRNSVIPTFAVLKDSEWYEKGKMGWWGMVKDEKEEEEWEDEWVKLIESLPDDTLFTILDCHT